MTKKQKKVLLTDDNIAKQDSDNNHNEATKGKNEKHKSENK